MNIVNFDNDYYLNGNDHFIRVITTDVAKKLSITYKNISTGGLISLSNNYPINNGFNSIEIMCVVSGLFGEVNPFNNTNNPTGAMQQFEISFTLDYIDINDEDQTETTVLNKYFVSGYADFLIDNFNFIIPTIDLYSFGSRLVFENVIAPFDLKHVANSTSIIVQNDSSLGYKVKTYNCNGRWIYFMNRLGGYELFYFDYFETLNKK